MAFHKLTEILALVQHKYPALNKRIREAEALGRWEIAVGPIIAKHSRAIRIQESVLWVEVDHPIWKAELHHRKRQILDLLNGTASATSPSELAPRELPATPKNVTQKKLDPKKTATKKTGIQKADQDLPPLLDILFLDPRPKVPPRIGSKFGS